MSPAVPPSPLVRLRPVASGDLPALFEFQLDPESNALAGTRPRDRAAFDAIWNGILGTPPPPPPPPPPPDVPTGPRVVARAILADGVLAGSISIFPQDGEPSVGYWIARAHWGRGIATRAIGLLLAETGVRPVHAQVRVGNTASVRALERNGFVTTGQEWCPGTDRYIEGEVRFMRRP